MREVDTSEEVRSFVPPDVLREFCEHIAMTELICWVCGAELPAGSSDASSVLGLVDDSDDSFSMVVPAHRSSSDSRVYEVVGLAAESGAGQRGGVETRWYLMAVPPGLLAVVFEPVTRILGSEPAQPDQVDVIVTDFLGRGFELITPPQIESDELANVVLLDEWCAAVDSDGLLVVTADDGRTAFEAEVGAAHVRPVRSAATETGRLGILTGTGLQPDADDRAASLIAGAAAGRLVGACVPFVASA